MKTFFFFIEKNENNNFKIIKLFNSLETYEKTVEKNEESIEEDDKEDLNEGFFE